MFVSPAWHSPVQNRKGRWSVVHACPSRFLMYTCRLGFFVLRDIVTPRAQELLGVGQHLAPDSGDFQNSLVATLVPTRHQVADDLDAVLDEDVGVALVEPKLSDWNVRREASLVAGIDLGDDLIAHAQALHEAIDLAFSVD